METQTLFNSLSKTHLVLAFIALMMLRVMIGYHFYSEGVSKLKTNGNWTAEPFLRAAKGPLAPMLQSILDDEDGRWRLCVTHPKDENGNVGPWTIDTTITEAIWTDFLDAAAEHFRFNDPMLIEELISNRDVLLGQIDVAKSTGDSSVDLQELERLRSNEEATIQAVRNQIQNADQIFQEHQEELVDWLDANRVELLAHFNTQDRLEGFDRDGKNRAQVAVGVESIRGQVYSIQTDRQKYLNEWYNDVEAIWDSFESQINNLAVKSQMENGRLSLHRPYDQPTSSQKFVDAFIPWFDTIVGGLLILGLFTRFASLSAALFLGSVILSQPFWMPGTKPTFYESVELFALLVIFATCAGRYGGLDFFFSQRKKDNPVEVNE